MSSTDADWQAGLPALIADHVRDWDLRLGSSYAGGSVSFVAQATTRNGVDAVFKLSVPHREARGEADALRWWDGQGAVRLLRHDPDAYALLIERCDPGTPLAADNTLPASTRLRIAAELLGRLWQTGLPTKSSFERVADVTAEWADLAEHRMAAIAPPYDAGLVVRGIDLLRTLPSTAEREVLVHGDFNPGNVLAATREPWLIIDPKPMVGDPGYDLWPLLLQIDDPFAAADPAAVLAERAALLAEVVGEPADRILAWSVARSVEAALWHADRLEVDRGAGKMAEAATLESILP